jgi:hypothetical protein
MSFRLFFCYAKWKRFVGVLSPEILAALGAKIPSLEPIQATKSKGKGIAVEATKIKLTKLVQIINNRGTISLLQKAEGRQRRHGRRHLEVL